jgi:KipI family sensor histidine kinase inhibitor
MSITLLSENTLIIHFEQKINHDIFLSVSLFTHQIELQLSEYIIDLIPSYNSIYILFNLNKISSAEIKKRIEKILAGEQNQLPKNGNKKQVEIPIYYGSEVALDLQDVAIRARLSIEDVIKIHSSRVYDVYAIGFAPGFAYLGNVDQRIATPRKATPRKKIPRGSLGIADQQTAIYPAVSPGGWQIIGRTPVALIDYDQEKMTLINVGDQVKFYPVSRDEYLNMGGAL